MAPAPLDFRVLGPLDIRAGGRPLSVKGAKQRLLLAVLLLHPNEVVSSDRLIDAVWAEHPPGSARKALQMHVSAVRDLLEPHRSSGATGGIIETRPPGYVLRVEPDQLDVLRFELLVRKARAASVAGRPQQTADACRAALALWRGAPFADLEFEPLLQPDIARLEELRVATLECRIDADLALGRHAEVAAEVERLVAEHPLREHLRAQLMLALYRSGRQADALAAYREGRRTLVEQLGIEPGRDLRELERRVLAQDPDLEAPSRPLPLSAAARGSTEALVGREREIADLVPRVDDALSGRGAVILIGGEPGIGKSRLADALAAHAAERGARVLVGRCWEVGGMPSYWPWIQALRSYVQGADREALRLQLARADHEVLTILPELRDLLGDPARPPAATVEGARFRLFEALASLLVSATDSQPVGVFFDDLHAADAATLLLLRFIARQLIDVPLLIVGCYRETQVGPELDAALMELAAEPVAHRIALTGLGRDATERLLEQTIGHALPGDLAARVHAHTDGNPFFATQIARLLATEAASGAIPPTLPMPAAAKEALRQRLSRQSARSLNLLTLASVIGREFEVRALARASGSEQEELLDALDEAAAVRLVDAVPGAAGRLRFSHVLVRDVLYNAVPGPHRLRLHRQVGLALEALYGANLDPHAAELAHHFMQAGSLEPQRAIAYSERAGDHAASLYDHGEAARHYRSALAGIDAAAGTDEQRTCRLLLALGDAHSRAGNAPEAKQALKRAAAIAEKGGWAAELAEAALGYGGRFSWTRAGTDPALVPLLERALVAVGDDESTARVALLARLAAAVRDDPRPARRVALAEQAVAVASRAGHAATLGRALEGQWVAVETPGSAGHGLLVGERIVSLAREAGDPELEFSGRDFRVNAFWKLAERTGVDVELEAAEAVAHELRQPAQRWSVSATRTMLALMEGDYGRAERLIAETAEIGAPALRWNAEVCRRLQLFVLRRAQGRLAELDETIARSVHEYPSLLRFRCAQAHLQAELGRTDEAAATLKGVLSCDLAEQYVDAEWLFTMSLLPDVCAFLDDADAASRLYGLLAPFERLYAQAPVEVAFGSIARGLGILATSMQRFDAAERHFTVAMQIERTMRARPWLAHAQHGLAHALLGRDAPGDRRRADALLEEARKAYHRLGMDTWAARAAEG